MTSELSPFVSVTSPVILHALSFLDKRGLQAIACASKHFHSLAEDLQIWELKTKTEFGEIDANKAKQFNKSWEATYDELVAIRSIRIEGGAAEVTQSEVKKETITDTNTVDRTNRVSSAVFGFLPSPLNSSAPYLPTATGSLGNRKITVFKK